MWKQIFNNRWHQTMVPAFNKTRGDKIGDRCTSKARLFPPLSVNTFCQMQNYLIFGKTQWYVSILKFFSAIYYKYPALIYVYLTELLKGLNDTVCKKVSDRLYHISRKRPMFVIIILNAHFFCFLSLCLKNISIH